ncbi:hypothetical protein CapIbe_016074 [Capra ibex]
MEDWVTAVCGPVPGAQEQTSRERGRLGTGDSGYQQTSLRQKLEARLPASTSPWVPLSLCEQGLSCWTEEGEEMFIHPSRTSDDLSPPLA